VRGADGQLQERVRGVALSADRRWSRSSMSAERTLMTNDLGAEACSKVRWDKRARGATAGPGARVRQGGKVSQLPGRSLVKSAWGQTSTSLTASRLTPLRWVRFLRLRAMARRFRRGGWLLCARVARPASKSRERAGGRVWRLGHARLTAYARPCKRLAPDRPGLPSLARSCSTDLDLQPALSSRPLAL